MQRSKKDEATIKRKAYMCGVFKVESFILTICKISCLKCGPIM